MTDGHLKPVIWLGDSRDDLTGMPKPVRGAFGIRLQALQRGNGALSIKALSQFGPGVFEMRESFDKNAYRLEYVLKLKKAIYVLHAFMKKSTSGIGMPRQDVALIAARLKKARAMDAEDR